MVMLYLFLFHLPLYELKCEKVKQVQNPYPLASFTEGVIGAGYMHVCNH